MIATIGRLLLAIAAVGVLSIDDWSNEMRIYTSESGESYTNAISAENGLDVDGHVYQIVSGSNQQELRFQLGPVELAGVNGAQNEQIIAALVHRIGVLNKRFPCRENSLAITKLEEAQLWLEKRTADRKARGVEGKNEK